MFNKNIEIYGKHGYLHAKAIIVDDKKAWMGSVNGSTEALTLNREFGIFFKDAHNVHKLAFEMNKDFRDPNAETWEESFDCAENGK
jgi:phosphatidylserine/phosphatidylglycerophosphate/cardiolipin synthase-like enzyme